MKSDNPTGVDIGQDGDNDNTKMRSFASLQQRFRKNIYGTYKGRLRLDLLTEDFNKVVLPQLNGTEKILDAGCGEACMSSLLIKAGHRVTLLDASQDMLDMAHKTLSEQAIDLARVTWCRGSLHRALPVMHGNFGLVIMHAVMEWLDEPWQGLQLVLEKVASEGLFSLAFYNRNSLIYRNLLQGNFRKLIKDNWQQSSTGLTPLNPIDPEQLYPFMARNGFELVSKRGIRCFYDFMRKDVKPARSYQDIFQMEQRYSQQEPFMSLGRYIHGIWRKTKMA